MKRDEAREAAEMKQSLAKEGLITLVALSSNIDHKQFSHHFNIVEGLCHLLVETVSCKTTASHMDKKIMIRDLMSRLERQLMWIGNAQKIIMTDYPMLKEAYYADNLNGIVSSAEKVMIANRNQSKTCDAYLKLVDMDEKSTLLTSRTLNDWSCYLEQLRKDWKKKNVLLYLNQTGGDDYLSQRLQRDAKALNQSGVISIKLSEDLVKCVHGEHFHAIVPGVLIDPSHSYFEYFYGQQLFFADCVFTLIFKACMSEEHLGIKNEKLAELLALFEEYSGRVCGSEMSRKVIKMHKSFDDGDIEGLKSGLDQVKTSLQWVDWNVKEHFKSIGEAHRFEAIDCWVKLKLPSKRTLNVECGPAVSE